MLRRSGGDRRRRVRSWSLRHELWLLGRCRGDLRLLRSLDCLRREEIVRGLVHFTATCDQPFYVQIREVGCHGGYEIEPWLVASSYDMSYAGTGDAYDVCELGLTEIFGRKELL